MNFSKRKSNLSVFASAFSLAALIIAAIPGVTNSIARAAGAGLDVEVPFEIKALKATGLVAPYFLQDNHGAMVVSDQAGGVFSVTFAGKVTELAGKAKIKNPAGVAIGPAGFGSYADNVFVLAAAGDIKAPCEVERIDKSGTLSTFAKLPDAGAAPTECRDQRQRDHLLDRLVGQGERVRHLQQTGPVRVEHDKIRARFRFEGAEPDADRDAREDGRSVETRPHRHGKCRRQDER
jgi:hypothetical protein